MFATWIPRFAVRNSPVVTGQIVARVPIHQWGIPRVDFTINVEGQNVQVHAFAQRYLMEQAPAKVAFHYTGDPTKEVFLFEHEENPLWIALFCWGVSAYLFVLLRFRRAALIAPARAAEVS